MKTLTFFLAMVLLFTSCKTNKLATSRSIDQPTVDLFDKYWKLIEINGAPATGTNREPFMILRKAENRVNGSGGCNSFFGSFESEGKLQIRFSGIGSTKMACPNMDVEGPLFQALEQADNYSIKGDTLSLNKAKMAPLARFVLVQGRKI